MLCESCHQPRPAGSWPICDDGSGKHGHTLPHGGTLLSAIHTSERAVVYRNPRTGEIRYPARADQPMQEVYARQGYERQELSTPQAIRTFERETGKLHERTHYDPGSGRADRDNAAEPAPYKRDPEVTRKLVEALR